MFLGGVSHFPSNFQLQELVEHLRQAATTTSTSPSPSAPSQPQPISVPAQQHRQPLPPPPQRPHNPQPPPPAAAAPIQRKLQVNPADYAIPRACDTKQAEIVFGCHGNGLTEFTEPVGLSNYANRYIVLSDQRCNRVMMFDLAGNVQKMFTCNGIIHGITINALGHVVIANSKAGRALAKSFTVDGKTIRAIGNQFTHEKPHGTATSKNLVAVSSLESNKVFVLDDCGRLIRELGGTGSRSMQLRAPYYVAFNSKQDVIVSDAGNHAIKIFSSGTNKHKLTIGGKRGSKPGELADPLGVTVDNNDNIIVCDSGNHRIQCFNSKGKFLGVVKDNIYGQQKGDNAGPRDLAVFAPNKLAVLVKGQGFSEIRVYSYNKKGEECVCM